jgi:RNA polymerase sigma-B factor
VVEVAGAAQVSRPMSLDTPTRAGEGESSLAEVVGAEAEEYGLIEYRVSLPGLIARLPEREQRVLSMRFYGNLTQSEIAQRIGVSQMQVSRLLAHSLDFLRRRLAD